MITQELLGYIKGEFSKGKTREEIRAELVKSGGWSEVDLNEAFRTVLPMQNMTQNSNTVVAKKSSPLLKILLIILLIAAGAAAWFYVYPMMNASNSVSVTDNTTTQPQTPVSNTPANTTNNTPNNTLVVSDNTSVKDCGVSKVPDLNNPVTYQNDAVLNCLGTSAINCQNAKGVLNDSSLPTNFEINKNATDQTCSFKISYANTSALTNASGQKLAGQYISCPLSIVKAIDESKATTTFNAPSISDLNKYAGQVYFYGILGVFIENGVDQSKIVDSGCSGGYISSVASSFNKQ